MRVYIIPLIVWFLLGTFLPQGNAQDCDCFGAGNCPTAVSLNSSGQVCYDLTDAFNNDLSDPTQGICGVSVTFTHAHLWDFELSLSSPAGQTIDLIGPNTNVFGTTNSVFWDITFIPCANSPDPDTINGNPFDPVWDNDQNWPFAAIFDGTYHPLAGNCLEDFNAGPVNGTWCLNYTNQPSTFSGEILNFEIILCDNSGLLCCDADAGDLSDFGTVQACEGAAELLLDLEPTYVLFAPDTAEYGYTFAISDDAGVVLEYDTLPDLTAYPAGTYSICGLSFKKEEEANIPPVDGSLTVTDLQLDFEGAAPSLCADISAFCVEVQIAAPPAPVNLVEVICAGESFEVGTESFDETNTYQIILEASTSCDSVVNLDLTVLDPDSTFFQETLCVNDSIVLAGVAYDSTDLYYIPFTNQFGCDSTVVLDLVVLDSIETFLTEQICAGESYTVGGDIFDATGMYTVTLTTALGCDSLVHLDLTVVDIEISFETPDILTCLQSVDTLFADVTGVSGGVSYLWSSQNGMMLGATDTESVIAGTAGTYVLEVTDFGCVEVDSIVVQSEQTAPTADAGLPDTLTCVLDSLQLDGSNSSTGATITYSWSTLDGNILSGASTTQPWVDISGTYQLLVLDTNNGCSDSAEVEIAINRDPPLVDAGPDQALDCVEQSVELDGSGSLADGNLLYEWTDGNGDPLPATDSLRITVSATGWYYLTIIDLANGCEAIDSAEVTDISVLPLVDAGPSATINCADPTVMLDGTASSSGPGITYLWSSPEGILQGSVDASIAVAADSGWYFLQVLNTFNNCLAIDSVYIALDTISPLTDAGADLEINCDVTEVLIGNPGGTSLGLDYTYAWENSAGQFLSNAITVFVDTGDTFLFTVTDTTNQCTATDTIIVFPDQDYPVSDAGPGGTLTCLQPALLLNGGNSTASPFIEYSWYDENGMVIGTDSLQSVSQPGIYCLSVVDGLNFCADTSCVEVLSAADFPLVDAGPDQLLDCQTGAAVLTGTTSGQGLPYVYEWSVISGGSIVSDPSQLEVTVSGVGLYELTVTDTLDDCTSSDQVSVQLDTMACLPVADAGAAGEVNCFNFPSDTLDATSGTTTGLNISYQWTALSGTIVSGGNTLTPVVDTGLYVLTVTNTLFGLTATDTVAVLPNLIEPVADAGPDATLNCATINNNYQLDGSGSTISVEMIYSWQTLGGNIVSGDSTLQPVIDAPGIYDLFIVNTLNGCTAQDAVLITLDGMPPDPCLQSSVQIACGDTSTVIGDLCPGVDFIYQWTVIQGTAIGALDDPTIVAVPLNGSGSFELLITDTTNACTSTFLVSVFSATNCIPDCVINFPDTLDCITETLTLDATGSSEGPEFVYDWTALSGSFCGDTTTLFPCVDEPGLYQLTVLNSATNFSCTAQITVTEDLEPPLVDAGVPMPLNLNCSGDPVLLNGQGFPDSTQAVFQWTGPDPACFVGSTIHPSASVTCPGTYYLTVIRDDNGCSAFDSLVVGLDTLTPVAGIPVPAPITCGNGNTLLQNTGSSTGVNIIYTWTFNNQVLSSGPAAISLLANQVGTYCLEVLNTSNSCVDIFCQEVIQDTDIPSSNAGPNLAIDCLNSVVTINGSGSMGASYGYQWTATNNNCIIGDPTELTIQAGCPGTYTLTVTDLTTNCQSTSSMVVADSTQLPLVNAGGDEMITCDSFSVSLDGSGSAQGAQYAYLWTAQPGNIVSGGTGLMPVVDAAGTYQLTVLNENTGCAATDQVEVGLDAGIPTVLAGADTVLSCAFPMILLEGSSSINTPSIIYEWEAAQGGSILSGALTPTPEVGTAGLYILTVTDTSNGCMASDSLTVGLDTIAPEAVILDTLPLEFNCLLSELILDGSASMPANALSFSWFTNDGNILSSSASPLVVIDTAGTYQLTVTRSSNGCVDSTAITVTEDFSVPEPLIADAAPLTCIDSMVVLDAGASMYDNPITVAWTAAPGSGLVIQDADQLIATVFEPSLYFVTLTYIENGCSATDTVEVLEDRMPPNAVAASTGVFDCMENLIGLSGVGSSEGPNYSYHWFSVDGGNVLGADGLYPEVDASGTYGLEVTDWDNGCRDTAYTFVESLAATILGLELSIKDPDCYEGSDGRILIDSVLGGTPPFLYALDERDYDVHIWYDYLEAGFYTLQVLDINGCTYDTTFLLNQPEEVVVDLGPDVELQLGNGTWLEALVNLDSAAIDTVIWRPLPDPDCPSCLKQWVAPINQTRYWVEVIDTSGCAAGDNLLVSVVTDVPVYLGNVFSPNGDGTNDEFYIFAGDGVEAVETFRIFDRWGNKVFQVDGFAPNNPFYGWDGNFQGKPLDPAVFIWWAEIRLKNGETVILKGDVTLVR